MIPQAAVQIEVIQGIVSQSIVSKKERPVIIQYL